MDSPAWGDSPINPSGGVMSDPITPAVIAETLTKAADHIVRYGWHQGGFFAYDPATVDSSMAIPDGIATVLPCCAAGAINVVAYGVPSYDDLYADSLGTVAKVALLDHLGIDHDGLLSTDLADWVGQWNDAEGRMPSEVVAALRGAASRLTEGGA